MLAVQNERFRDRDDRSDGRDQQGDPGVVNPPVRNGQDEVAKPTRKRHHRTRHHIPADQHPDTGAGRQQIPLRSPESESIPEGSPRWVEVLIDQRGVGEYDSGRRVFDRGAFETAQLSRGQFERHPDRPAGSGSPQAKPIAFVKFAAVPRVVGLTSIRSRERCACGERPHHISNGPVSGCVVADDQFVREPLLGDEAIELRGEEPLPVVGTKCDRQHGSPRHAAPPRNTVIIGGAIGNGPRRSPRCSPRLLNADRSERGCTSETEWPVVGCTATVCSAGFPRSDPRTRSSSTCSPAARRTRPRCPQTDSESLKRQYPERVPSVGGCGSTRFCRVGCARRGYTACHALGSLSPRLRKVPMVLTIHDLIYRHFPESVPLGHRLFMRAVQPGAARRADRVIVDSAHGAREVVELLGVREDRVRVVPLGGGQTFRRVTDAEAVAAVLKRYGLREPYVIAVGRGYPHKNVAGLLRRLAVLALSSTRRSDSC